jgi:hypothetical protein
MADALVVLKTGDTSVRLVKGLHSRIGAIVRSGFRIQPAIVPKSVQRDLAQVGIRRLPIMVVNGNKYVGNSAILGFFDEAVHSMRVNQAQMPYIEAARRDVPPQDPDDMQEWMLRSLQEGFTGKASPGSDEREDSTGHMLKARAEQAAAARASRNAPQQPTDGGRVPPPAARQRESPVATARRNVEQAYTQGDEEGMHRPNVDASDFDENDRDEQMLRRHLENIGDAI